MRSRSSFFPQTMAMSLSIAAIDAYACTAFVTGILNSMENQSDGTFDPMFSTGVKIGAFVFGVLKGGFFGKYLSDKFIALYNRLEVLESENLRTTPVEGVPLLR